MKGVLKKYNSLPRQIRASLWYFICNFSQKAISVIFTPIFTRLFTTNEYGHYGVYNSWEMFISVFVTLNLSYGVFTQGMVKNSSDRKNFAASFQGLSLILLLLWLAIYLSFQSIINGVTGLETKEMVVMLLNSWIVASYGLWAAEQRIEYKYRKLILTTLLASLLNPILGVIFVHYFTDRVFGRVFAVLIVNAIVYFFPVLSSFFNGGKLFHLGYWRYALIFNIPLIPHYLSQTILSNSDRIMIEKYVGASQAGIYNLAYSVAVVTVMFNSTLLQTIHPWLYQQIKGDKIYRIKKVVYPSFILIAFVNLILIIFAPELVGIFAPRQYYEAIWVIPPIAMSSLFNYSYGLFADFEFYYDKPYLATGASICAAVLNILLNHIFIRKFGYFAAAYTTLVSYILLAVLHYCFMKWICNKYLERCRPYNVIKIVTGAVIFLLIGFGFMFTYTFPLVRYGIVIVGLVIVVLLRKKIKNQILVFMEIQSGGML